MQRSTPLIALLAGLLVACGESQEEQVPRLAVISASETPKLPAGGLPRQPAEALTTHSYLTPQLAFGGTLRVTWSSFVRGSNRYIHDIKVVSTTPVRSDLRIDFGVPDSVRKEELTLHTARFATTWVNRRGALVHDYFEVLGDGSCEYLGTYVD